MADQESLRRAFGTFATGVSVVTVGGVHAHGMTANSFGSVSLDPPLALICIDRCSYMNRSLRACGGFGVSVLSAGQEAIARYFANAQRPRGPAQFGLVDWSPGQRTGAPLIDGALVHFEFELWRTYDGGDHSIFVGQLLAMTEPAGADALVFLRGRYVQAGAGITRLPASFGS